MKKLIIKIGNEKHELPYNGETFSFEVEEKYMPKVGDCVKISFKDSKFEYFGKISQIVKKEILLKSSVNEISRVILNLSLCYDYRDIFYTKITPEELKAKYAEVGYDWDYESDTVKPIKWKPKDGDKVWFYSLLCEVVSYIFDKDNTMLQLLAEKGFLFPTEAECQKFADHCLQYFDKK